jgi:hypothetical protein
MHSVRNPHRRQASLAVALVLAVCAVFSGPATRPAAGFSLFARHVVEVHFAAPDGKPMAGVEVHVFAPGNPPRIVATGRTDKDGKFEFEADREGMWSAEVHQGGQVARVTVRVGPENEGSGTVSPYLVVGGALFLLVLAIVFRVLRARSRRPR